MKRALFALALVAGCSSPRTEVVLTVHASGIRIPDDVDAVRLQIADRNPSVGDDPLFDQPVPLCSDATAGTAGCYSLPITVTLFPGSMRPADSVRVQVDAQRRGTPVIADAALFTFSEGHSLRLDVILYANCLGNVACAQRDLACGPDSQCSALGTMPLGEEPDLALGDLSATPPDLTLTDGMSQPLDFTVLPDMTIPDLTGVDLLNCVPQCGGKMCGYDGCSSTCGTCGTNLYCDPTQNCAACGTLGAPCCPGIKTHGQPSPQVLPGGCNAGLVCDINTVCTPPPDLSMPPPDLSMPPPDMTVCGQIGQPCCFGTTCFSGLCAFPDCVGMMPSDGFLPPG